MRPARKSRPVQSDTPTLLLLHALPFGAEMWSAQLDLLPGATLAPDLYSLGASLPGWAEALLGRIENDNLIVAGCSVGGSCALEIAAIAPHRVSALVLIGTKAGHRPDPGLRMEAARLLGEGQLDIAWERYWAPLFSSFSPSETLGSARAAALRQSAGNIARGVEAFHTRPDRADLLARLQCPVHVVSGSDDTAPGPATSANQAASTPLGRFRAIPDCGHYVPLERPDALNEILRTVISDVRSSR